MNARLRKDQIALIGCQGYNVKMRLADELRQLDPQSIVGYDVVDVSDHGHQFACHQVQDDNQLAERLSRQAPSDVLIQTPDDVHARHIRHALRAGASRVICEKPLATTVAEAEELVDICKAIGPKQEVLILDHYRNIELVQLLAANAPRWLGEVTRLRIDLLEAQDIPPHQVRSHSQGMANFLHHALAVAGQFFDLREFEPAVALKANHPDSPVPDTFRAAVFERNGSHPATIQGAVGKYIEQPHKKISVEGTRGSANLDRDANLLSVSCKDGWSLTLKSEPDTGYRGLARALTSGESLPSFMRIQQAAAAVRLIEAAHERADWLHQYPDGRAELFIGDTVQRRAA